VKRWEDRKRWEGVSRFGVVDNSSPLLSHLFLPRVPHWKQATGERDSLVVGITSAETKAENMHFVLSRRWVGEAWCHTINVSL